MHLTCDAGQEVEQGTLAFLQGPADLEALDGRVGGLEGPEPERGADQAFERPMIRLGDVVEVARRPMADVRWQAALLQGNGRGAALFKHLGQFTVLAVPSPPSRARSRRRSAVLGSHSPARPRHRARLPITTSRLPRTSWDRAPCGLQILPAPDRASWRSRLRWASVSAARRSWVSTSAAPTRRSGEASGNAPTLTARRLGSRLGGRAPSGWRRACGGGEARAARGRRGLRARSPPAGPRGSGRGVAAGRDPLGEGGLGPGRGAGGPDRAPLGADALGGREARGVMDGVSRARWSWQRRPA